MTKAEAYWILDELRKEFSSELYGEAFGIAQECIELVDLMSERASTITNADRIRAMTDEELADWICGVYDDDEDNAKFICGTYIRPYNDHSILEWLKQPVEEVDDER